LAVNSLSHGNPGHNVGPMTQESLQKEKKTSES